MKPNPLLILAASLYSVAGIGLTFAAEELLAQLGVGPSPLTTWVGQLLGAALFSLAWLNWMLRTTRTAGIYGRPMLVSNLLFFAVAAWASLGVWRHDASLTAALAVAVVLAPLALAFAVRLLAPGPGEG